MEYGAWIQGVGACLQCEAAQAQDDARAREVAIVTAERAKLAAWNAGEPLKAQP